MSESFFDRMSDQSQAKATIVTKYFRAWTKIIISTAKRNEQRYGKKDSRLGYVDLFAGPGRYKDGSKSTPLLILELTLEKKEISERLVSIFNDKDSEITHLLRNEIANLAGAEKLRYKPQVMNKEVDSEMIELIETLDRIPTLFFVDPFGYKGLTQSLINVSLQNWGSDCIFFFNYNRISMDLPNEIVKEHMDALFGKENADDLRKQLHQVSPKDREITIVEALAQSLEEMGANYVLPFRFRNARGTRTSHHLIFVSKDSLGYKIMKEIMAGESSTSELGVPSFEYNPAIRGLSRLFELKRPLGELGEMLLEAFAGQTVTMGQIYEKHNVGRPFIEKNYKDVLQELEAAGKIKADPPAEKRPNRKGIPTFAEHVRVIFPPKS